MRDEFLDSFTQAKEEVKVRDTSKKVRVGIIGCGGIAMAHMKEYVKMEDVEVVAGADIVPGRAKAFFEKFNRPDIKCYDSHEALIDNEKLDIVSVCTYNTQHAGPTIYALDHGVNVLLEKPFTVTLDEAIEVMKAEKRSGKLLSIGYQPRMSKNMQMIKKIVESGEIGKVYYMQAGGGRRRGIPYGYDSSFIDVNKGGIGAVGDIGTYSLDMLLGAVGYPKPLTVTGYMSDYFGKDPKYYGNNPEMAEIFGVDDFAAAFIRLEGDIILDFRISWAMHMDTAGDALILGTKGGIRIPSTDCWNGEFPTPMTIYKTLEGQEISYKVPLINHGANFQGFFYEKLRGFVDAVVEGKPAPVPTSEIIYNQAIIDAIVKSSKIKKEIEVEIPEI